MLMINSLSDNPQQEDVEKKKQYIAIIKQDTVDETTYKEIYAMIPESFLVEKDRDMADPFGIKRKTTKWKFNKIKDKDIIDTLKQFAKEKKF